MSGTLSMLCNDVVMHTLSFLTVSEVCKCERVCKKFQFFSDLAVTVYFPPKETFIYHEEYIQAAEAYKHGYRKVIEKIAPIYGIPQRWDLSKLLYVRRNEKDVVLYDGNPLSFYQGARSTEDTVALDYFYKIYENALDYRNCESKAEKTKIMQRVLDYVQKEKGGHFLGGTIPGEEGRWYVLSPKSARIKVRQALMNKELWQLIGRHQEADAN